jgi:hypothetical protein
MPDTITIEIPADAPDRDVGRVRREARVARRRAKIQRLYPELRDEHGRRQAFERLRDRFGESVRTIRRIIYGG